MDFKAEYRILKSATGPTVKKTVNMSISHTGVPELNAVSTPESSFLLMQTLGNSNAAQVI